MNGNTGTPPLPSGLGGPAPTPPPSQSGTGTAGQQAPATGGTNPPPPQPQQQRNGNRVRPNSRWNDPSVLVIWAIFALIMFALGGMGLFFNQKTTYTVGTSQISWNWGTIFWTIGAIYALFSFRIVGPDKIGLRIFLGRPLHDLGSGPHLIPAFICSFRTETRLTIEDELPGDPEHVVDVEANQTVPPGKVRPIRVTFDRKHPEQGEYDPRWEIKFVDDDEGDEKKDPLSERIASTIQIIVRWRIKDIVTFVRVIGSVEQARRQFQDIVVSWAERELSRVRAKDAQRNVSGFSAMLQHNVQIAVGQEDNPHGPRKEFWGIEIETVQIKGLGFSHTFNRILQQVPAAKAEAQATIISADARKQRLIREGEGFAKQAELELKARTTGMVDMALKLGVPATTIVAAETARGVTRGENEKVIIAGAGGFGQLVGALAGVKEALQDKPDPTGAPPPPTPSPSPAPSPAPQPQNRKKRNRKGGTP